MPPTRQPALAVGAPASDRAELAALARLAGPLVGANLLQMGVFAVDVVFVARLGTVDFAAATLGVFLFNLLTFAMIGLTGAAAPLIAAELGRRRHAVREVRRSVRMALWAGLVGALPLMLLLANGEALLRLLGQDAEVARRAGRFLALLLFAMPPAIAGAVVRATAATLGRPHWAFWITGLALGVAILGNWCLVFGHLGSPAMGLSGSAIASVVTATTTLAAYLIVLRLDRRLRRYRLLGRWWRPEWLRLGEIVRLGLPIALTWTFEGGLFGGAAVLMGLIGVADVAAHSVALNIAAIAFQVPFGIAQAATIRVGFAYGAGDSRWIGRAGRVALAAGIGFMGPTAILMWAMPRALIGLYIDPDLPANAEVAGLAIGFLGVAAVFQLVDGAQAVAAGILRGLQDTRVPMLIALIGYWAIGFGIAALLGFGTPLKGMGIWWGLAVGLLAVSLALVARWRARGRLGLLPTNNPWPAG